MEQFAVHLGYKWLINKNSPIMSLVLSRQASILCKTLTSDGSILKKQLKMRYSSVKSKFVSYAIDMVDTLINQDNKSTLFWEMTKSIGNYHAILCAETIKKIYEETRKKRYLTSFYQICRVFTCGVCYGQHLSIFTDKHFELQTSK